MCSSGTFGMLGKGCSLGNSPVLRAFYRKYLYSEKYVKYRKYALGGGKGVSHFATPLTSGTTCAFSALMVSLYPSAAAGQALTCPLFVPSLSR